MPVQPVTEDLFADFCAFIARSTGGRTAQDVERIYRYPWIEAKPNYGFAIVDRGNIVGALGAIYSLRTLGDEQRRFCNLADWFVDADHRSKSVDLLFAVLTQPGYSFTALTATKDVTMILRGFGFKVVDPDKVVILSAAHAAVPRAAKVLADRTEIASHLSPSDRGLFDSLSDMHEARYLVLTGQGDDVHVVLRFETRKRLRFAVLLHVSAPNALHGYLPELGRWVFVHGGALLMLASPTMMDVSPLFSRRVADPRPPLFMSKEVRREQVDMLFSELTR